MKQGFIKRLLAVVLTVAMLAAWAVPAAAVEAPDVTFTQVDNQKVSAQIPGRDSFAEAEKQHEYADSETVRVSIVLDKESTLEAGYDFSALAENAAAMCYSDSLESFQDRMISRIEKVLEEDLDVVWNLTLVANMLSANVEYGKISDIKDMHGVKDVVIETEYLPCVYSKGGDNPNMATSGEQIGSAPAWAAGYTGAGSRIAVIDTGTDVEHKSFNAAAFEYSLKQNAQKAGVSYEEYVAELDLLDVEEIAAVADKLHVKVDPDTVYLNSKLPYGYNYVDDNYNISHLRDNGSEHGSHVAGISAANAYVAKDDGFVSALKDVYVQGVAPDAQVLTMKVFGENGGAYDSDYMVALEDAILLGADSVNMSFGSNFAGDAAVADAAYQKIFDNLSKSGVLVSVSAGNSGYWAEFAQNLQPGSSLLYSDDVNMQTAGSPGTYTNALTVASVDNSGTTALYLSVGDSIVYYSDSTGYSNQPLATIAGEHEYVLIDGVGTPEQWAALGDSLKGKIAMCSRGETSFFEKANAAVEAGAIATIVYNNQPGVINLNMTGYNYEAPCVSITQADGQLFRDNGKKVMDGENVLCYTGTMTVSDELRSGQLNNDYYTMSNFSSWGVPGSLELKPEITAPGGNIYSVNGAHMGGVMDHVSYESMSGTSMAAPQITGMAAVAAQYLRESGLVEKTGHDARFLLQSLMMSTAEPIVDGNSGTYYPVIQQGAGLANVGNMITADSYITMGADATASYADGKVKAELGDDPDRTGVYTFTFDINNLTDAEEYFELDGTFFVQYPYEQDGVIFMTPLCANIMPSVSWVVDGAAIAPSDPMAGADFNGDGTVNNADAQALLDYATGARTELFHKEMADMDGDEDIDSYDAYLFYSRTVSGGCRIAANDSVTVQVTVTLSEDDKAELNALYPNGTYLQGYVFADSTNYADGTVGTSHSIPVMGFYGNWTDASMLDVGSFIEYTYGMETRAPYIDPACNAFLVEYANEPGTAYAFGGNPVLQDDTYMPERNAINGVNGDMISAVQLGVIRNTAATVLMVEKNGDEMLVSKDVGPMKAGFFDPQSQSWANIPTGLNLGLDPSIFGEHLAENDVLTVGVALVPEYYIRDGKIDAAALGEGAFFETSMAIDNTAPVLKEVTVDNEAKTLTIHISENQYVAAVALFDEFGEHLYQAEGSKPDAAAGKDCTYTLDLTEVNGAKFLLQVFDYANNVSTYEINQNIGQVTDAIESVTLSRNSLVLAQGDSAALSASVNPVNATDRSVTWTTSDEAVATVDANGVVTAVKEGNCQITAASVKDPTKTAVCQVSVKVVDVTISGVLQNADGDGRLYSWNLKADKTWTEGAAVDAQLATATINPTTGDILLMSAESSKILKVNPTTGETTELSGPCGFGAPLNGLAYAELASSKAGADVLFGIYGAYLLGPSTAADNDFSNGWNLTGLMQEHTGGSKFVALANGGVDGETDVLYALDDANQIWVLTYDGTDEISIGLLNTTLGLTYPGYEGIPFCSLIAGDDGNMYLSAFDGNTNVIYQLSLNLADMENIYIDSMRIGTFGDGVWPATVTKAVANAAETPDAGQASLKDLEIKTVVTMKAETLAAPEAPAAGGLNAVGARISQKPSEDGKTVTVTVTPKDAEGKDIASTNGVVTVTYDKDVLELASVNVFGALKSVNKMDGAVTYGYVADEAIGAGSPSATLVFNVKANAETEITVAHEEANDTNPDLVETVEVEKHVDQPVVKGAKEATCTEDGYTGDTYCAVCGELLKKGEVIPATGHEMGQWEVVKKATETEDGLEVRKCSKCDYTESRVIPAFGNAETGDNTNLVLLTVVLVLSAAGIACLSVYGLRKRKI